MRAQQASKLSILIQNNNYNFYFSDVGREKLKFYVNVIRKWEAESLKLFLIIVSGKVNFTLKYEMAAKS